MKNINDVDLWGIKGGGFGLYGYLPALSNWQSNKINIESKHKVFLNQRSELKKYIRKINWISTEDELFSKSTSLIFCVPPTIQYNLLYKIKNNNFNKIILEKPLAKNPDLSFKLLSSSIENSKRVRIGYSILMTDWAIKFIEEINKNNGVFLINIEWDFLANHIKNNFINIWKASHQEGGGVLRFYGIHLIALIASLNSLNSLKIISSKIYFENNLAVRWDASFGVFQKIINININITSQNENFKIKINEKNFIELFNPFDNNLNYKNEDARILSLIRTLDTFNDNNNAYYALYENTISLWRSIELSSIHIFL